MHCPNESVFNANAYESGRWTYIEDTYLQSAHTSLNEYPSTLEMVHNHMYTTSRHYVGGPSAVAVAIDNIRRGRRWMES